MKETDKAKMHGNVFRGSSRTVLWKVLENLLKGQPFLFLRQPFFFLQGVLFLQSAKREKISDLVSILT
jgi:hypothetical protein